jgi:hypothetical protein
MRCAGSGKAVFIGSDVTTRDALRLALNQSGHELSASAESLHGAVHLLGKIAREEVDADAIILQPDLSANRHDGGEELTLRDIASYLGLPQRIISHKHGRQLALLGERPAQHMRSAQELVQVFEAGLEEDFNAAVAAYDGLPLEGV